MSYPVCYTIHMIMKEYEATYTNESPEEYPNGKVTLHRRNTDARVKHPVPMGTYHIMNWHSFDDMGASLAEGISDASFAPMFITARLWGIADTAPYLHDGRALTLNDAILGHGGEGQTVRDNYASLTPMQRQQVVAFLQTLRTPVGVATDLY